MCNPQLVGKILNPVGAVAPKRGFGRVFDPAGAVGRKIGGQHGASIDPGGALRDPEAFNKNSPFQFVDPFPTFQPNTFSSINDTRNGVVSSVDRPLSQGGSLSQAMGLLPEETNPVNAPFRSPRVITA